MDMRFGKNLPQKFINHRNDLSCGTSVGAGAAVAGLTFLLLSLNTSGDVVCPRYSAVFIRKAHQ